MYVLLNLKDGSRLTDVVQLLFSHGHTAVSVAENIEDLCPSCERRNNHKTSGAEHNDDSSLTKSLLHEAKTDKLSTSAQLLGNSPNMEGDGTAVARERDGEQFINKTEHVPPPEPAEIKEEPSEFTVATTSSAEPTSNNDSAHFITSALELLGHATASTMDHGDAELDKEHNGPPSKRKARIENLGLEIFQCQMDGHNPNEDPALLFMDTDLEEDDANIPKTGEGQDDPVAAWLSLQKLRRHQATSSSLRHQLEEVEGPKASCRRRCYGCYQSMSRKFGCMVASSRAKKLCKKAITRQGQYANLVNHLSRHARLHASKKQYCCPVCRASFSRRYLAYAHVKEAHPSAGHVEPLDHGRELREEYRALLEVCFPGASSRRKRNIDHDLRDKNAEDDAHDNAERSGVLSKLLEQQ
ncbi:unnamed protein product [Cylicocyclus nassatus]|uniref:C2H2-type domain-containing protein n=1 Tax=Cylicocyclus nassatus TaxID=53992 RepID=A0AA36HCW6_CYLNA|nr:unnamed protein product [Cylicocyclus nassatus]